MSLTNAFLCQGGGRKVRQDGKIYSENINNTTVILRCFFVWFHGHLNKVNFDIWFHQNASSAGVATTRVLQAQPRQVSSSLASGTATSITLGATTSLTPTSSAAVVSQVRWSCHLVGAIVEEDTSCSFNSFNHTHCPTKPIYKVI